MAGSSADHVSIARPYAKALFAIASEAGALDEWSAALGAAAKIVEDREAGDFLGRPSVDDAGRLAFLESVLAEVPEAAVLASPQGRSLLKLLAENDRLGALASVAAAFDELKAQAENRVKVKLVAASTVDAEHAGKIGAALERKLGHKVELEVEVDPALIGGAVIQAEDRVIDASVRSRLKRLTETLVG
jgi:F-type H+-transporting ATPase subunit delta